MEPVEAVDIKGVEESIIGSELIAGSSRQHHTLQITMLKSLDPDLFGLVLHHLDIADVVKFGGVSHSTSKALYGRKYTLLPHDTLTDSIDALVTASDHDPVTLGDIVRSLEAELGIILDKDTKKTIVKPRVAAIASPSSPPTRTADGNRNGTDGTTSPDRDSDDSVEFDASSVAKKL